MLNFERVVGWSTREHVRAAQIVRSRVFTREVGWCGRAEKMQYYVCNSRGTRKVRMAFSTRPMFVCVCVIVHCAFGSEGGWAARNKIDMDLFLDEDKTNYRSISFVCNQSITVRVHAWSNYHRPRLYVFQIIVILDV